MIRTHAMKQMRHLQANSLSVRITENLVGRLQITIGFRAWKQYKKQLYLLGERACVLACALIGVMNARYICLFLFFFVVVFFQKGESTII